MVLNLAFQAVLFSADRTIEMMLLFSEEEDILTARRWAPRHIFIFIFHITLESELLVSF